MVTKRVQLRRFYEHRFPNNVTDIFSTLVEAAKWAPKQSHELALVYERAREKGNVNRATIAVARKMVTYLLAVDRANRPFVPAEKRNTAAA